MENQENFDDIVLGQPVESSPKLEAGTEVLVRFYSFAQIGTLIMGKHNNWACPINYGFEVLAVIEEDEFTSEEALNFEKAGKVFREENGRQPFGIGQMQYSYDKNMDFFGKLYGKGFEPHANGGFTVPQLRNVMNKVYRITVGANTVGKATFMNVDIFQRKLSLDAGKKIIARAREFMTLNDIHMYFTGVDLIAKKRITSAAELVNTDMFRKLKMSHRNMVRRSKEFLRFPDSAQYAAEEKRD